MDNSAERARFEGARLLYDAGGETDTCDATFLISTLLVFVAKGDGAISELETGKMLDVLASHLGAGNAEALQSLSAAVMTLANDKEIALKLREVGQDLSPAETEEVFDLMLEIAAVDDELDTGEAEAIKFAGQILGLSQDRIYSALRALAAR
jgi:uncharacterized tellurite resistance protein B-like protein